MWTGGEEAKWVGWLHIADTELQGIDTLKRFAEQVNKAGVKHVVLLGHSGGGTVMSAYQFVAEGARQ